MTLIHLAIVLPMAVLFLFALIDALRVDIDGSKRVSWVFVIVLLPVVGAVAWFLVGRRSALRSPAAPSPRPE